MAQPTNLFSAFDAVGIREDLADIIYNVSPSETPFMSAIGRETCSATYHEWQLDSLDPVNTSNFQLEGDDASFQAITATTRVGNRTQISSKQVVISGTLLAVSTAGRDNELAYQRTKKAIELKRDMEAIMIGTNQASTASTEGNARKLGSLRTWLTSNTEVSTGGGSTGFSGGNTVAATDSTTTNLQTFSQTDLDSVISKMWTASGNVDGVLGLCGAKQKGLWTNFDGIASAVNTESAKRKIINTADIYVSQFGEVRIVAERYIRTNANTLDREVYLVNPSYAAVGYLRPFFEQDIAKTGDAEKKQMIVEYTLIVKNEAAHGIIADLA